MGKRRRKRAGFWLKGICLILLVPVFITTLMQRMRLENLIYGKEGAQEVWNTIDSVEGMEREVREHQENKKISCQDRQRHKVETVRMRMKKLR